jgi:hypothetical protein
VAVPTAPTRPLGTLASGWGAGYGVAIDSLEHVTDLMWPLSVQTYSRMRHDPTLTSVIAGYRHPILKADWRIDPRGASDRMVKICADSLGLPVLGQPDQPGPVRRRGVKWLDHLRLAVNGSLIFGHSPFEPTYDTSTGSAMLAALGERLPQSIAFIDVNDDGTLKSISQVGTVTAPNPDPIPGDRLLWYVRDREGAAWQGNSILRPAFGAWLLKQDALRVHATSLRRFGAGTPVMTPSRARSPPPPRSPPPRPRPPRSESGTPQPSPSPGSSWRSSASPGPSPTACRSWRTWTSRWPAPPSHRCWTSATPRTGPARWGRRSPTSSAWPSSPPPTPSRSRPPSCA